MARNEYCSFATLAEGFIIDLFIFVVSNFIAFKTSANLLFDACFILYVHMNVLFLFISWTFVLFHFMIQKANLRRTLLNTQHISLANLFVIYIRILLAIIMASVLFSLSLSVSLQHVWASLNEHWQFIAVKWQLQWLLSYLQVNWTWENRIWKSVHIFLATTLEILYSWIFQWKTRNQKKNKQSKSSQYLFQVIARKSFAPAWNRSWWA